jgi:hypothetical protein
MDLLLTHLKRCETVIHFLKEAGLIIAYRW